MTTGAAEGRRAWPVGRWLAPVVGATAAFVLLYAPVIRELLTAWQRIPYYSYGFLVLPWSAWLVWSARSRVMAIPFHLDLGGLAIVAVGLGVLAFAGALSSLTLAVLSLPIMLGGLGRFALGRDAFRPLVFPIGFLALMAPLPPALIPVLSEHLQGLAAWVTAGVLTVLGIPFAREGVFIHLRTAIVHVSEWCNGLRFLLAMTVLGVAFGWTTGRRPAIRVLVLALTLVAAIVANLVRVAGTTVLVHVWGPAASIGLFHNLFGKAVYLATVGVVLLVVLRLRED